MMGQSGRSKNN